MSNTLDNIILTPLRRINVKGGNVLHGLKSNEKSFKGFKEIYFSMIEENSVKAWKKHLKMTLNLIVPVGVVEFVFFDEEDHCRKEVIGNQRYLRITVPPGIWFGFKGLYYPYSLVTNIADICHDPSEIERKLINEYNYDWGLSK